MNALPLILTVVVAHFLALLSPGPDFLLVVKSAIRSRKNCAVGVAFGIASANAIYIILCIVGVGEILSRSLVLMRILKLLGGVFLCYVAFMALRARKGDYAYIGNASVGGADAKVSFFGEYLTGFISGITNPKNLIFYLSLFSVILNRNIGLSLKIGLGLWMTALVFLWDAFIIFVLAQDRVRKAFSRIAFYVDKVAGTILGLIGITLVRAAVVGDD
jgi:threonine/homoserine/homoserine lactone efflux protein